MRVRVALLAAISLMCSACGPPSQIGDTPETAPIADPQPTAYRNELIADVYEPPEGAASLDVVVVALHGCCGDRRDLAPIAEAIAGTGATVVNADVRALPAGGGWPATYLDAVCAIAWASGIALEGSPDTKLAVLGWSDGALVAASVVLGWPIFAAAVDDGCDAPIPPDGPDIAIGVSGHYGWTGEVPDHLRTDRAAEWFGGPPDSGSIGWSQGNPGWWVTQHDVVRTTHFVLLGTIDDRNTEWFADRLVEYAVPVELTLFERASHDALILPHGDMGERALQVIEQVLSRP